MDKPSSSKPTLHDDDPSVSEVVLGGGQPTKKCNRCGEVKPLTKFYRNSATRDGRQTQCIPCRKASLAENTGKRLEKIKEMEQLRVFGLKRCAKCGEIKILEGFSVDRNRKDGRQPYCQDCNSNGEIRRKIAKRKILRARGLKRCGHCHRILPLSHFKRNSWKADNLNVQCNECVAEYRLKPEVQERRRRNQRRSYKENPDPYRLKVRRRTDVICGLPNTLTNEEWESIKEFWNHSCAYCGRDDRPLTIEHVVPVVSGGPLVKDNVVPACKPCNSSKHTKDVREWMISKGRDFEAFNKKLRRQQEEEF